MLPSTGALAHSDFSLSHLVHLFLTSSVLLPTSMPHLTDLVARRRGRPFHTLEFFPPRTEAGFVNLLDRINRLSSGPLPAPLAISVTWGAGGSTADRTMELAEQAVKLGLDVILHLTCTNMPKEKVDQALKVGHTMS
jgi:methylenetetrahydrofolate reductase (NADPH)